MEGVERLGIGILDLIDFDHEQTRTHQGNWFKNYVKYVWTMVTPGASKQFWPYRAKVVNCDGMAWWN